MPLGGLLLGGVGAATNLIGGLLGRGAAKDAAAAQKAASYQAIGAVNTNTNDALGRVAANTRSANAGLDPYAAGGASAQTQLGDALKNPFQFNMADDPGYAFRLAQGQKAVEGSAAARGGALSGGNLKALTQYGQGFASNEYQNAFARHQQQLQNLFQESGIGLNAATTQSGNYNTNSADTSNLLGQNSNLISGLLTGAGNAEAAGKVGGANAFTAGLTGAAQNAQQGFLLSLLSKNSGGAGAGAGGSTLDMANGGVVLP